MAFKPTDEQQRLGFTLGARLDGIKLFLVGFDQHVFHVPTVVEFDDGNDHCAPTGCGPGNARKRPETTKPAIRHWCSRRRLDSQVRQVNILRDSWGIAGFVKLNLNLTPKSYLSLRLNTSRYWGSNNVYIDSASPVTTNSIADNGEENVDT
jgi:hypothetical protein